MGKKDKKRNKMTPSPSVERIVKYSDLPDDQKITFSLDDRFNLLIRYKNLLRWLRWWSWKDGLSFEGIRNSACLGGYPLLEVTVVSGNTSGKFLVTRGSLYHLAFFSPLRGWRLFEDSEMKIEGEGFREMNCSAKYTGEPWIKLGPKVMIDALARLEDPVDLNASEGCQVWMVHISEAARTPPIQLVIESSLLPSMSLECHSLYDDAENDFHLDGSTGVADIYESLKKARVNLKVSITAPKYVKHFIKKFKELSTAWYFYALSEKKFCPLKKQIAKDCGILNRRSLRYSLAILCNSPLDNILFKAKQRFQNRDLEDFPITENILEVLQKNIEKKEKRQREKAQAYGVQLIPNQPQPDESCVGR